MWLLKYLVNLTLTLWAIFGLGLFLAPLCWFVAVYRDGWRMATEMLWSDIVEAKTLIVEAFCGEIDLLS